MVFYVEDILMALWNSFITSIPGIIGAIIALVVGFIVGKVLGKIVKEIVIRLKVDEYIGQEEKFAFKISDILSLIVRWWIYLVFIQEAARYLGIAVVMQFISSIVAFLPGLIEAALIIVVGYVLAEYIKDRIISSKTIYASIVGKVIFFLMVYLSVALALPFVGIDATLVNAILLVFIGSVGLGMAIAMGLGLKGVIESEAKKYVGKINVKRKR
ncbi:MAG: hypothetical protein J7K26_03620 [Candidatus Aenigmarchaeota archaeon]|nr:hypothetical protein [Candidatus Aenigmarchaeota archaeon]